MRRHASRAELALLLLLSGDVHPNPGPTVRVGQLNCAGLTKEKRLSLLRHAADVDAPTGAQDVWSASGASSFPKLML